MTAGVEVNAPSDTPRPGWKRAAIVVGKLVVVGVVLAFVGQTVRDGWGQLTERQLTVSPAWALASCGAYAFAQLVMAWLWRRVLVALDQPAPAGAATAAFYISQLGKYVPGKASVVLIRTERLLTSLRRRPAEKVPSARAIGASVFYETLTYMAVGSLLSAGLIAFATPSADEHAWVVALALGLAVVCLTPTLPPVFGWLLARATGAEGRAAVRERLRGRLTYGLAGVGAAASLVAWGLMGVSVWMAAEAVGSSGGRGLGDLPLWTLAGALPAVAGFVSLLPAGLGVREGLSLVLLNPALGEGNALAVTVAARLVGVATEVVLCASLLGSGFARGRRDRPSPDDPS